LGLRAFAEAKLPDAEYWILGEGPELKRLQTLAKDLKIEHQIKFLGHLSRDEALVKLGSSSVLVHPSLHDSGGLVCLEAMAASRPVICLNLGGPAVQVTAETGFVIQAHTPEQSVADMASAMAMLAQDPEMLLKMGQAGQRRVRDLFTWESKGKLFTQIYQDLISHRKPATKI
jgi:glycosyltransferase involved in cell wall biosynthesis